MQGGVVKATARPAADGVYSFANVAAGSGYTVKASLAGYDDNETVPFEVAANVSGKNLTLILTTTPPPPPPPPGPGEISGTTTLWGNSAAYTNDGADTGITISWTNVSDSLSITDLTTAGVVSGKNITVTFVKTGGNTGNDRISFGKIAELKAALTTAGAASVAMKSSAESEKAVAPVFNSDEIFGWPATLSGKVFDKYTTDNEKIFNEIRVRNTSGNGWHIEVPSGQRVIVTKLNLIAYPTVSSNTYLNGFGLKVTNKDDITFDNPVLTGLNQASSNAQVAPSKLDDAFELLKLDSKSDFPVFTGVTNSGIYLDKIGADENIAASVRVVAFLTKTIEDSTIANLENLVAVDSSLIFAKSIPFDGNGIIDPFSDADKVNGNLAVWLGSKGVALQEVYLTNPGLYASTPTTLTQTVRNAVLEGNDWQKITMSGSGVIVSVNTPVAGIPNSSNLWYVVQGQNSDHTVVANVDIIELGTGAFTDYIKIAPNSTNPIVGRITPNVTVKNSMNANWNVPSGKDYYPGSPNNTRPVIDWEEYADIVKGSGTPTFE
jgi:hypothetical protein